MCGVDFMFWLFHCQGGGALTPIGQGFIGASKPVWAALRPAVDYRLFSPHPASQIWNERRYAARVLTAHDDLNIGFSLFDGMSYKQWVLRNRKGRGIIDSCAMTACKFVSSDVSGKSAALIFGLTGVAGFFSIQLHLIPKRRYICDPTLFSPIT
jgi:hypothetical protein